MATKLTMLQHQAFDLARDRLKDEDWFTGLSLGDIPTDDECRSNMDLAVSRIVIATRTWDDPDYS